MDYDPKYPMLIRNYNNNHPQLNLVGYSYGSVVAAQLAMKYAIGGTHVDHLVLVGSPIRQSFLSALKNQSLIRNIIIVNLDEQGDPIYAGMSSLALATSTPVLMWQIVNGTGHFYYSVEGQEGDKRRQDLAQFLYNKGLR